MMKVLVEYDYDATQPDELTIKKGDIISEVRKLDGGWWEGLLNGKKGLFPDNFVKDYAPDGSKPVTSKPSKPAVAVPAGQGSKVDDLKNKIGAGIRVGPPPSVKPAGKSKVMAVVVFGYDPQQQDELPLEEGDMVEVTKQPQEEEGWWEGFSKGRKGMFPSNFVKVVETNGAPAVSPVASLDRARPPSDQKVDSGMMRSRARPPPPIPDEEPAPALALPPRNRGPMAKVVFSYHAQNDDELSLTEGQTVLVLDQHLEDQGWWKGELHGKSGVFPDNFVELLPNSEPAPPPKAPLPAKALPARASPPSMQRQMKPPPKEPTLIEPVPNRFGVAESSVKAQVEPPLMAKAKPPAQPIQPPTAAPPVQDDRAMVALQAEMKALRATTVSKESHEKLQQDLNATKASLESFKKDTLKKLLDLMKEIDEERKQATQNHVELNRLRKLAEDQWMKN